MTPIPSATKNLAVLVTAMTLTVAACGGADSAAPAKAPASERSTSDHDAFVEPRTVEEAQDQIARARASLEGADKKAGDARPDAPKTPSPSPQGGAAGREERPEDACGSPCRALASMRRAVDALCRITGDGDNRCADAKRTLTESATRVSSCKCEGR